jgi:hypothetical protein
MTMAVSDTSGLGLTWVQQAGNNGSAQGYTGVWTAQVPAAPVASSSSSLITAVGPANTVVQVFPGAQVPAICPVAGTGAPLFLGTATTAAPTLNTSGDNENAVMQVQPGMLVRAVVLVDTSGNFVS